MAITYPLSLPTNIGIANITLSAENAVGISQSPFTYQQQVIQHQGQRWRASVTLPSMKRQDAESWLAFLLSLKGQVGTFLLGDPNGKTPQGKARAKKNQLIYTEKFNNAAWTKTRVSIIDNSVTDPNNNLLADTLVEDTTATNTHQLTQTDSFVAGTIYTFSLYVKMKDNTRNIRLALPLSLFSVVSAAVFNPADGTIVTTSSGTTSAIQNVGNGWYRVSVSKVCSTTGTGDVNIALTLGTSTTYTGDGVSGHYIWGAQLEASSSMTSYQGIEANYGPSVNGGSQTGSTLLIKDCSPSVTGFLSAGDYIQLGSSSTATLYKVLSSVNTDDSGLASVDIWPNITSAYADSSAVVVENTVGLFRLSTNIQQWQIDDISSYGISFDCVEAL